MICGPKYIEKILAYMDTPFVNKKSSSVEPPFILNMELVF